MSKDSLGGDYLCTCKSPEPKEKRKDLCATCGLKIPSSVEAFCCCITPSVMSTDVNFCVSCKRNILASPRFDGPKQSSPAHSFQVVARNAKETTTRILVTFESGREFTMVGCREEIDKLKDAAFDVLRKRGYHVSEIEIA